MQKLFTPHFFGLIFLFGSPFFTSFSSFQSGGLLAQGPVALCKTVVFVEAGTGLVDQFLCPGETGPNGPLVDSPGSITRSAASFNDGSYSPAGGPVWFKVRRTTITPCSGTAFNDAVKFCCADVGEQIEVIFRVYDVNPGPGPVSETAFAGHFGDCPLVVWPSEIIKPFCKAPPNLTMTCVEAISGDELPWTGDLEFYDNCAIQNIDTAFQYLPSQATFETVGFGLVRRIFTVTDCQGLFSKSTQTLTAHYREQFRIDFPNDIDTSVCGANTLTPPVIFGENCEQIDLSFTDAIDPVAVPGVCYHINRTWKVKNLTTFNPSAGSFQMPNPLASKTGAKIWIGGSPGGSMPGWAVANSAAPDVPTVNTLNINYPGNLTAPGTPSWTYTQEIRLRDLVLPILATLDSMPPATVYQFCDTTENDPLAWNANMAYDPWQLDNAWSETYQTADLPEGRTGLAIKGRDACSGSNVFFSYQLFLDLDGDGATETTVNSSMPTLGFGLRQDEYSGNFKVARVTRNPEFDDLPPVSDFQQKTVFDLPFGQHKIRWTITDGCGNLTSQEFPIEVKDCKKPLIGCINGISVNELSWPNAPAGQPFVALPATAFFTTSQDNLTAPAQLEYALRDADINPGTGFPESGVDGLYWDCTQLGTNAVEMWVRDLAGNADFCLSYLILSDNLGWCTADPPIGSQVSGLVKTAAQWNLPAQNPGGVAEVSISIKVVPSNPGIPNFDPPFITTDLGAFNFSDLPLVGNFEIGPFKDINPLNGVSTFDLVAMSKHILGVKKFVSPYEWIAADINRNKQVTTFDIVELRKLILGVFTDFPANDSWRFVAKNFVFTSPLPLSEAFPEKIPFTAGNGQNLDFVGIKIGDLNNDVIPNNVVEMAADRSPETVFLETADHEFQAGDAFEIPFLMNEKVLAGQFTLQFENFEIVGIQPENGLSVENFALFPENGKLAASFHGLEKPAQFNLKCRAFANGQLANSLQIIDSPTAPAAWKIDDERRRHLELSFKNGSAENGFELFQNRPNPFSEKTEIRFRLPESSDVSLKIFDRLGRLVFEKQGQFESGLNSIFVSENELPATASMLFYQLSTPTDSATRSLVLMR